MLVLTRKPGERVVIGEPGHEVSVLVVRSGPNQVQLGFEAAGEIPILREELLVDLNSGMIDQGRRDGVATARI